MLLLNFRLNEGFDAGDMHVKVIRINRDSVRLGITAPPTRRIVKCLRVTPKTLDCDRPTGVDFRRGTDGHAANLDG